MAARGGTISGIGKQDGGPVDDNDPGSGPPLEQFSPNADFPRPMGLGDIPHDVDQPRSHMPPQPSMPPSRGFDPYRYMNKPEPGSYAAAQASPWMAALAAGLGILGKAGARDAHGLPISGAAAIGQGAQSGLDVMKTQQEQEMKQREAALRARQLEAQWEQHQQQMQLDIGKMTGTLNGRQTLEGARNPVEIDAIKARGEEAQIRIKMREAQNQQQLEFYKQQLLREQDIQDQLAQGIITAQQAEAMRRVNRDTPAPGSRFDYHPVNGLTPKAQ